MSPKDFSSVFSRQFVVGHFLPAFFALAVVALAGSDEAVPAAFSESGDLGAKLLILGVAALPLGLLLSSMHAHVLRMFAGEATERAITEHQLAGKSEKKWPRFIASWHKLRADRQDKLRKEWRKRLVAGDQLAALTLDQRFPDESVKAPILPTRLGNALRAFQTHADSRFGLDGALVWPRLELLLDDGERGTIDDARTDVAFFLNCLVVSIGVAGWLAVDAIVISRQNYGLLAFDAALAILLFLSFRLLTVTAAYRWGMPVRAAMDLHRLELYDHLGLRRPANGVEERELSEAVNDWLRGGAPAPEAWWAQGGPPPGR